jgi:hypothetical protein
MSSHDKRDDDIHELNDKHEFQHSHAPDKPPPHGSVPPQQTHETPPTPDKQLKVPSVDKQLDHLVDSAKEANKKLETKSKLPSTELVIPPIFPDLIAQKLTAEQDKIIRLFRTRGMDSRQQLQAWEELFHILTTSSSS